MTYEQLKEFLCMCCKEEITIYRHSLLNTIRTSEDMILNFPLDSKDRNKKQSYSLIDIKPDMPHIELEDVQRIDIANSNGFMEDFTIVYRMRDDQQMDICAITIHMFSPGFVVCKPSIEKLFKK